MSVAIESQMQNLQHSNTATQQLCATPIQAEDHTKLAALATRAFEWALTPIQLQPLLGAPVLVGAMVYLCARNSRANPRVSMHSQQRTVGAVN